MRGHQHTIIPAQSVWENLVGKDSICSLRDSGEELCPTIGITSDSNIILLKSDIDYAALFITRECHCIVVRQTGVALSATLIPLTQPLVS